MVGGAVQFAHAAGGSIKTSTGSCGSPVNKNQYVEGDVVYITGTGFARDTTLDWSVVGLPSSSDPNTLVASGSILTDSQGKFCFAAYTVLAGDSGEYKADVNGKTDNYQVAGPQGGSPTPTPSTSATPVVTPTPSVTPTPTPNATLHVVKVVVNDNGGTAVPGDFTLHVDGNDFAGESAPGTEFSLADGTYTVTEDADSDYMASYSGACDSNGDVTLAPGDDVTCTVTNDDIPGEIHGMKFEDINGDGGWDTGEPGLQDWVINLYDSGMVFMASTSTDASGSYEFDDLDMGTYNVRETQMTGWTQTTTDPSPIAIGLGDVVNDVDFGNFDNVSITGFKLDANGASLSAWTIFIDETPYNDTWDAGEDSLVTTSSMGYTFEDLGPGTYHVCEMIQSGWQPQSGTFCQDVVVDMSGENMTGINFVNLQDREGTQGYWRNWKNHTRTTSQATLQAWLLTIHNDSNWLMPSGYTPTGASLTKLIDDATKNCSKGFSTTQCAKNKFYAQYISTRLDVMSGRKDMDTWYSVSPAAQALLGLGAMEQLDDIIAAAEAWVDSGLRADYLTLAGQFDMINNTGY